MNVRHLVLVGLPGSGKSTVGRLVADRFDRALLDIDSIIEERAGTTIAAIFDADGEQGFRRWERDAMGDALARSDPAVIVPGGGWAATGPGIVSATADRALTIYLTIDPQTAAARVGETSHRPWLPREGRTQHMRELLERRQLYYAGCEADIPIEGLAPGDVAERVAELARKLAGW